MLLFYIIFVWFRLKDHISGVDFATSMTAVTIAFLSANMGIHIIKTAKDFILSKFKKEKKDETSN